MKFEVKNMVKTAAALDCVWSHKTTHTQPRSRHTSDSALHTSATCMIAVSQLSQSLRESQTQMCCVLRFPVAYRRRWRFERVCCQQQQIQWNVTNSFGRCDVFVRCCQVRRTYCRTRFLIAGWYACGWYWTNFSVLICVNHFVHFFVILKQMIFKILT